MSQDDFDGFVAVLETILVSALGQVEQTGGPPRTGLSEAEVVQLVIEHGNISDDALAAIHNERTGQQVKRLTVLRRRKIATKRLQQMRSGLAARFGPAGRRAVDMGVTLLAKKPWPPPKAICDKPAQAPAPAPRLTPQQRRSRERQILLANLRKKGVAVAAAAQRVGCSERQAYELLRRAS